MRVVTSHHYCTGAEQLVLIRLGMVVTHAGWAAAVLLAFLADNLWLTALAIGTILFSCLFHLTGKFVLEMIDIGYATFCALVNLLLLYLAQASLLEWLVSLGVGSLALLVYKISTTYHTYPRCWCYAKWHALWHVIASFTTLLIYSVYLDYWRF